ncbi:hypothetical protein CICLE_v10022534mg [Citrus x clementina]|uniref:Sulfotransferase n=1 Tax=Citrus clementina TaxID=85681 RepID=V4U0V4_CITCL|nr:hypothetical protein CICLE_v10022534mg [Citrus x clementina]
MRKLPHFYLHSDIAQIVSVLVPNFSMENSKNSSATAEEKAKEDQELFLTQLPKVKICTGFDLFQYQAFWCPSIAINGVISFQKHFQAEESDIILVPYRKSGTAWLKTLTFSIVNRSRYAIENSPLLTPLIILYLSLSLTSITIITNLWILNAFRVRQEGCFERMYHMLHYQVPF